MKEVWHNNLPFVNKITTWKEINLAFDKKPEKPQNKNKKFNPTIIDGGKK